MDVSHPLSLWAAQSPLFSRSPATDAILFAPPGARLSSLAGPRSPVVSQMSPLFVPNHWLTGRVIASPAEKKGHRPLGVVLHDAGLKALGGGLPGAASMGAQVLLLMWMRTTINYQYRHGGSTLSALKHLWGEGGVARFYRGLGPALIQAPLSRFGDTAANAGVLSLLDSYDSTRELPVAVKTACASLCAASVRVVLMPIDTIKTTLQVEGKKGFQAVLDKVRVGGPTVLFHGAMGAAAANLAGHYPWFLIYNSLHGYLPKYEDDLVKKLLRNMAIGFCAQVVADTTSNSFRVIKTYKQTHATPITYMHAITELHAKEGVTGILFRGLGTKLVSNAVQGMLFTVLWRLMQDALEARQKAAQPAEGSRS